MKKKNYSGPRVRSTGMGISTPVHKSCNPGRRPNLTWNITDHHRNTRDSKSVLNTNHIGKLHCNQNNNALLLNII